MILIEKKVGSHDFQFDTTDYKVNGLIPQLIQNFLVVTSKLFKH